MQGSTAPTLEEAIDAAEGMASRQEDVIEIAVALSGATKEEVRRLLERRPPRVPEVYVPTKCAAEPHRKHGPNQPVPKKIPVQKLKPASPPAKVNWNRTDEWGL